MSDSRLVYSTDGGDRRRRDQPKPQDDGPRDGRVRVSREKGRRGGKVVTIVRGLARADLDATASDLKRHCGAGGAVKADTIEIQGDHRDKVAARLEALGHRVKLAGG